MGANAKSPEELKAELEAEQQAQKDKIEDAGTKAGEEAAKKGATPEEVAAAVEKARKEEKDKLYPQIEALKTGLKEVQDMLREEREEKARLKKEAEEEAERQRKAKLSESDRHTEALQRIEEQLKEEREARLRLEEDQRKRDREARLEQYRQTAIQAAGDEIIPDLVRGNTEAEIDAAVLIAKARYAEFAERFKQEAGDRTRRNMPRTTNPDTAALEEQELSEQLNAVDVERYRTDEKYQDQIKAEIARAYGQAAGRI